MAYLKIKKIPMENQTPYTSFLSILTENRPAAIAWISGNDTHPTLNGLVR